VGFGAEILFIVLLGLLVLGPKRLHTVLVEVARAKAQFEETSRGFKSQLTAELEAASQGSGGHERSRFLAAENSTEPDPSGLARGDYEMVEAVATQQSPRQLLSQ
jgi:Sec-independent protein translocase protein TatA